MKKDETKFELRNIDDLIPYIRNARTHSPEQVNKLAGSIKEFGFINPIIISDDGGVLAGHGRILAAKKLGMKQVPCVIESHLTEAQKRAYILADNRLALDAGWDEEMLRLELTELKDLNFKLELLGFNDEELSQYFTDDNFEQIEDTENDSEEEEKEIEVDEEEPITHLGELWILGNHRIICGDSRDENIVKRLFGNDSPNLMVTDPPYGIGYNPSKQRGGNRSFSKGRSAEIINDDISSWKDAYQHFKGNVAYVWHANLKTDVIMKDLRDCGFEITSVIIWNKNHFAVSWADYKFKHEPCIYATRGNHNWQGKHDQSTVWDIKAIQFLKDEGAWGHSTQKPVECMKRPIENNSVEGEYVYDPFLGSGTTVIAAERTGRKCLGCEISPKFCDAIIQRWEEETGEQAVNENGEYFDDLAK